jgi:tRNA A-37 threonylcarbamoyl transferase component Bud32
MDAPGSASGDAAPTKSAVAGQSEARRAFYVSLEGSAVGGRYQLGDLIDFGSMGAVFHARHRTDEGARYAVKLLDPDLATRDRKYVRRFLREARILKTVDHPNIVKVFEYGLWEPPGSGRSLYYYVMELVEGPEGRPLTLHHYARSRSLRMEEVVYIVSQILSGLGHVHARGVVHRDLKPWNVLIDAEGKCRIVDFGLAKIPDSDLTDVDELFGSRDYIAPELFYRGAREATPAADLYAVGRIFAELIDRVDFRRHRAGVFASKAAALKYLGELLARLRAENPALRYGSAEELLGVLREFQDSIRIRPTVSTSARMRKAARIASSARARAVRTAARALYDYGLFVTGVIALPFVVAESRAVGAILGSFLVTSKLWSAFSHPPDRHPVAIVVRALAARLNRLEKGGDFRAQFFVPGSPLFGRGTLFSAREVSDGHRRQYRALAFPLGSGPVGLAARARTSVILHSVPRWGTEPFRRLYEEHLGVPEQTWSLLDPTRRSFLAVPLFRVVRSRSRPALRVAGVLAVDSRLPDAFLSGELQRPVQDYAAVIQDFLEPVHGSAVRAIAAACGEPLETILVNGQDPRVPPIEARGTL